MDSIASGDLKQARVDLEAASRLTPSDPKVCLVLTQIYARSGEEKLRGDSAAHCVDLAHRKEGWQTRASIHNYLGKVYLANAALNNALSEYREAVRLDPYDESYRFDLAQTLLNHERFAEAALVLEDAHRVFDKSAQLELALGVAYYGQRRFPEAVNSFLRTIELAPEVTQPYVFLGRMIDQAGERLPEVTERFRAFRKNNPENYLAGLLLAKALAAASGDLDQRETLLRESIGLKSDNWENHYELGVLLEARHNFTGAAKELELSLRLNPDIAATHYHLSRVYDRLNRPEDAAKERVIHQQLNSRDQITAGMEVTR